MPDNFLQRFTRPTARGKLWQVFLLIFLLVFIGSLIDAGSYYNKGIDYISTKTGGSVKLPKVKEVPFRLGLDLLGGTHLVYRADMSQVPEADRTNALEGVRDVIERRVNVFGVSEPVVQTSISGSEYRVIVELAGIKDVNKAISMIGETPLLEFKELDTSGGKLSAEEKEKLDNINKQAEDTATDVLGKLLSGGDFSALAKEFTQDKETKESGGDLGWITEKDKPELVKIAKNLTIGEITPELIKTSGGYEIVKLEDKREKSNPFKADEIEKEVKASHLLICYNESENCESGLSRDEAKKKIEELKKIATPANFDKLVRENSTEPGAKTSGGELGWFDSTTMVKPFTDAVWPQKVGTISFVVETKFGFHLIYKQDERPIIEYKLRHIYIPTLSEADITGSQRHWKNTELTGKNLKRATVTLNRNDNTQQVSLEFDSEGAKLFADITGRNVGKPVAIYLDGSSISEPTVNEKITGGKAVITGNFTIMEAKKLAQRLNAGALPVPIELINQQTVGASLGQASLTASLKAAIIGLILVAVFMIFFYRLPGLLAVFSLVMYGILVLAIFKMWPVTLTLAGLAGFILSVGMAVDANVLIFERLKEELKSGKSLGRSIQEGFKRAWPSIRDGNASTLITCLILINFSTSVVKGFAITLGIGVIISMFSAIIITKNLLQLFSGNWLEKKLWLVGIKKND